MKNKNKKAPKLENTQIGKFHGRQKSKTKVDKKIKKASI
ncbi:hypothetical protein CSQ_1255 [Campylobacter jejuni subsp. jejuni DFVF1099]|nr:hypothetical protein CSQ_1255 [Campylobacter jejuni subsp. jejuni DFVF1099]